MTDRKCPTVGQVKQATTLRGLWRMSSFTRYAAEGGLTLWCLHSAPISVGLSIGFIFLLLEGVASTVGDLMSHLRAGEDV